MLHWFFLSSNNFPFVGGVGKNLDKVVFNRLSVNCSIVMLTTAGCLKSCRENELRGVGGGMLGLELETLAFCMGVHPLMVFLLKLFLIRDEQLKQMIHGELVQ
ncbi:hypothetical protein Tco_0458306 [Tanacetum coccineum]